MEDTVNAPNANVEAVSLVEDVTNDAKSPPKSRQQFFEELKKALASDETSMGQVLDALIEVASAFFLMAESVGLDGFSINSTMMFLSID